MRTVFLALCGQLAQVALFMGAAAALTLGLLRFH